MPNDESSPDATSPVGPGAQCPPSQRGENSPAGGIEEVLAGQGPPPPGSGTAGLPPPPGSSAGDSSVLPGPSIAAAPAESTSSPGAWWKRRTTIIGAVLVAVAFLAGIGIGVAISGASSNSGVQTTGTEESGQGAMGTTTSTEPAVTTTTAPAIGTRQNPLPVGLPIPAGDWELTVTGYETGIDVRAFNPYNDPPPAGSIATRLKLSAKFSGEGTGSPASIRVNLVGPDGATYSSESVAGGSRGEPMDLASQTETFKGGTVTGDLYYFVPATTVNAKMLAFVPDVNYTDVPGGVGFFAVN